MGAVPTMRELEGDCACLDQASLDELREVAGAQWLTVLSDYLQNGQAHEQALLDAQASADWASVARVAHNIKGAYGYLGAQQLVSACTQLLSLVREDAPATAELEQLTGAILEHFRCVRRCLRQLLGAQAANHPE